MERTAWYEPTKTLMDFEQKANQAYIQLGEDGFSVFNLDDKSYLLTFKDRKVAEQFARDYEAANMRRKGVSKVWMRFLPMSEDKDDQVSPDSKMLKMPSPQEMEQQRKDLLLAPQTFEERREKFKTLKEKGLPHVPELKKELEEFRMRPERPHGAELPSPTGVPSPKTIEELTRDREKLQLPQKSRVALWLARNCKYAKIA